MFVTVYLQPERARTRSDSELCLTLFLPSVARLQTPQELCKTISQAINAGEFQAFKLNQAAGLLLKN